MDKELPPLPESKELPELPDKPFPTDLVTKQDSRVTQDKGLPPIPEPKREVKDKRMEQLEKSVEKQKKKQQEDYLDDLEEQEKEAESRRKRREKRKRAHKKRGRSREDDDFDYDEERGIGCFRFLFNCRCLGCGGFILIWGVILFIVYVLVARPPAVIDPAKEFLNAGLTAHQHDGTTLEGASIELGLQVSEFAVGENQLTITESQLKPLINARLVELQLTEIHVDVEPGEMKVYWDASGGEEVPFWVVLKLGTDQNGNAELTYVGTERIAVPEFLNETATRIALTALNVTGVSTESELIEILLPLPDNAAVSSIEFVQDEMQATIEVSTGLENLFTF